ncbi:MAG: cation-efflux pump [Ardenticatenales bacterium]
MNPPGRSAQKPGPSAQIPGPSAQIPSRSAQIQRVLLVTLGLNVLAAAVKLGAGAYSGSLALLAGGVDAAFDGLANVAGLAATRVAARPPDADHPYGHRKYETLVGVVIAALLFLTCWRLANEALQHLGFAAATAAADRPRLAAADISWPVLLAPLLAAAINWITGRYEGARGRALGSELLVADAGHTKADAWVSLSIVIGLGAVRAGLAWVDPLLALGIAVVVAWTGWRIVRETTSVLADAAVLDPNAVADATLQVPGVVGTHAIRSRGTLDAIALDLHVQVDPHLGVGRAHAIGHAVKDTLTQRFPGAADIVVHVEPDWNLAGNGVVAAVRRALDGFPVEAHDVHVHVDAAGRTEVGLHLELDPDLSLAEAHDIATSVESAVRGEVPEAVRVVTHLEPRPSAADLAAEPDGDRDWESLVADQIAGIAGLSHPHDLSVVRVPGGIRLSVHVEAAPSLPLATAHALAEALEARLRAVGAELERVTIHVEPP